MADWKQEYRDKLISAKQAAGLVKDGMWIDFGGMNNHPFLIDDYIAERRDELHDVKFRSVLVMRMPPKVVQVDPKGEHFTFYDWFFTPWLRPYQYEDRGAGRFLPMTFHHYNSYYLKGLASVDIAFITATAPEHGYFNFGGATAAAWDILHSAKIKVLEINESYPWVYGGFHECIHVSEVDYLVESDPGKYKPPGFPVVPPNETDYKIADHVVGMMRDGDCVEFGVGGIPTAIGYRISQAGLKHLGVHTELMVDNVYQLVESGNIDCSRKNIDKGKITFTTLGASAGLLKIVDHNPLFAGYPTSYINDPAVIASIDNMVALNGTLFVDLLSQAASENMGPLDQISGTGGQLNFTIGGYNSNGGRAFLVTYSTYTDKKGEIHSRIVPLLPPGVVVTVPRSCMQYVVTEYGVADLVAQPIYERAKRLIAIAHPDFREDLERQARELKIIPKYIF